MWDDKTHLVFISNITFGQRTGYKAVIQYHANIMCMYCTGCQASVYIQSTMNNIIIHTNFREVLNYIFVAPNPYLCTICID